MLSKVGRSFPVANEFFYLTVVRLWNVGFVIIVSRAEDAFVRVVLMLDEKRRKIIFVIKNGFAISMK